jgi:ribosome-binding protein aMBF1 (putative translation factor)
VAKRIESFTDQIRRAVEASGMSHYSICKRIGLDKGVMSRFVNGKGFLAEKSLNNLAAVLGLGVTVSAKASRKNQSNSSRK